MACVNILPASIDIKPYSELVSKSSIMNSRLKIFDFEGVNPTVSIRDVTRYQGLHVKTTPER